MQRRRAGRDARPDYLGQQQQASQLSQSSMGGAPYSMPPMQPAFTPGFMTSQQQNNNYAAETTQLPQPPRTVTPLRHPSRLGTPSAQPVAVPNGLPPRPPSGKVVDNYDPSWEWGSEDSSQADSEKNTGTQQPQPLYSANAAYNQQYLQNNQYPANVQQQQFSGNVPPVSNNQYSGYNHQAPPPMQNVAPPAPKPTSSHSQVTNAYRAPQPPTQPSWETNARLNAPPQQATVPPEMKSEPTYGYPTHEEPPRQAAVSHHAYAGNGMPDYHSQGSVQQNVEPQTYDQQYNSYEGYSNEQDYYAQNPYQPQHYPTEAQPDSYYNQAQPLVPNALHSQAYAEEGYYQNSEEFNNRGGNEAQLTNENQYQQFSQGLEAQSLPTEKANEEHTVRADPVATGGDLSLQGIQSADALSLPGGNQGAVSPALSESGPLHENLYQGRSKSDFSITSSMNQQDYEGSVASQRSVQDYYDDQQDSFRQEGEVVDSVSISDRLESISLTDGRSRIGSETNWESRNGEQHTRTSAVSFALDALDTMPGPRLPMDSDAWSRASTWGSGYDDHPRSILSSPPNELNENNGAKSIERSNSFDGSSIVESYAPGSVDSESLSNVRFDDRDSKAVSGRTTPFEENSVSRNLSREPSFDRCSREDASDVAALPPSSISFHDGFEVMMKPTPVTDSTASLVGSQSMLSSMTASSPYVENKLNRLESQVTVIDQANGRVGAERTDAEGSLDSGAAAWPPVRAPANRIATLDEADGAGDTYPQQSRQAAYGQPAATAHPSKFSRPSSAASRPSPATTPSVPYNQQTRPTAETASVLRPSYPEGPNYVAEDEGSNSSPSGFSHSASFSRELPPSSQRMVPGMSGVDLGQVQPEEERRGRPPQRRPMPPQAGQRVPQQRPQGVIPPPQPEVPSSQLRKISAGSQRLEQPPEGAVEYVQDDRLPIQGSNVDPRGQAAPLAPRPNNHPPPVHEDRTDPRHRHSAEPERSMVPVDQARTAHPPSRPELRGSHGPEGAPAPQPPQQISGRLRTPVPYQNIPQNLGPHPDPEGTASAAPVVRPAPHPHPQTYPVHSTPEHNADIIHPRPEGSPFTSVGSRDGTRLRGATPIEDDSRRYQGSGVGSNGKLNEDSARVVTGYALNDTTHSMAGDRNLASQRAPEGPSGAPAARSALIGSEQDLSARGDDRLDDRRSREPDDRRPRRDRRRYDDEEYSDRRYDDRGRFRDHRRYAGEDSDEEVRSYYEDRRERRRGERDRRYADDELYPPSRSSVFGEDADRPARDVPYHEDDKHHRRYGRDRLDSSRNDRRDYDRSDPRDHRAREGRDPRDPYFRDRDYYRDRDRDPYTSRRREGAMPGYPYGGADFPMYYPSAAYYDPRYQHYYAQYYAQMYARARPGMPAAPAPVPTASGTEERVGSRCSTADEIRRERASAAGSIPEVGAVPETPERKFYDDVHVKGSFLLDGNLLQMVSGLPTHQIPSCVSFMDLGQVYESLPDYEELKSFPGPLIRGQTNTIGLIRFCNDKISHLQNTRGSSMDLVQSRILVWEYLVLLLKTNGSPEGVDVARLLLQDQELPERTTLEAADTTSQEDILSNERTLLAPRSDDAVREYKALVHLGCKQKALDLAVKKGLWGHAFMLSLSMDQKAISTVRNKFTRSLSAYDSLQTFYQLESGRQPEACTTLGDERKLSDWRSHLAVILSNSSRDPQLERRSIIAMGDSLALRGDLYASQLCYLIARVEFGSFTDKSSRLTLVGTSKWEQTSSSPSLETIQMTEIYEYAVSLSNPGFCIKPLMVHKFCYARSLVDHGFLLEAYRYCEAMWNTLSATFTQDDISLASQVYTLADRLKLNDPSCLVYDEYGNKTVVNPEWLNAFYTRLCTPVQTEDAAPSSWQQEAPVSIEPVQPEAEAPPPEFYSPLAVEPAPDSLPYQPQPSEMESQQYPSFTGSYDGYYNASQPVTSTEEVPSPFYQQQYISSEQPSSLPSFATPSSASMETTENQQEQVRQERSLQEAPAPAAVDNKPAVEESPKTSAKEEDKPKQEKQGFLKRILGMGGGAQPKKAILPDDKEKKIVWDAQKKMWVDKDNPDATEAYAKPPPMASSSTVANAATASPLVAAPEATQMATPPGSYRPAAGRAGPRARRIDVLRKNDSPASHPFLLPSGTPTEAAQATPIGQAPASPFMFVPAPSTDGLS